MLLTLYMGEYSPSEIYNARGISQGLYKSQKIIFSHIYCKQPV